MHMETSGPGKKKLWDPSMMQVPWVDSPFFETMLARKSLSAADAALARKFHDDGFAVIESGIPENELDATISALKGMHKVGAFGFDSRIQDADFEPVKRLTQCQPVLNALRMLYDREPVPFQTLNFEVGTQQRAHSDAIHFSSVPHKFLCGAWIALEDCDSDNGPLFYYPRSHKLQFEDLNTIGAASLQDGGYWQYEVFAESLVQELKLERQEFHPKKGQVLLWTSGLIHGGTPVKDPKRTRYSQVTHYNFRDCVYFYPPLTDFTIGKVQLRKITDRRNGEVVPDMYKGKLYNRPTPYGESQSSHDPTVPKKKGLPYRVVRKVVKELKKRLPSG
jgi:Phytanoyl-CoA dioxygenase (PhyH)